MSQTQSDPTSTNRAVLLARPLIDAFLRSGQCPSAHRFHARTSLPLIALFLGSTEEIDSRGVPWHRLSPDALLDASLDANAGEKRYIRDLFDVCAAFYLFLADEGVLQRSEAHHIRTRLVELAVGFS